jgi:hypothetical protein
MLDTASREGFVSLSPSSFILHPSGGGSSDRNAASASFALSTAGRTGAHQTGHAANFPTNLAAFARR